MKEPQKLNEWCKEIPQNLAPQERGLFQRVHHGRFLYALVLMKPVSPVEKGGKL